MLGLWAPGGGEGWGSSSFLGARKMEAGEAGGPGTDVLCAGLAGSGQEGCSPWGGVPAVGRTHLRSRSFAHWDLCL